MGCSVRVDEPRVAQGRKDSTLTEQRSPTDPEQELPSKSGDSNLDQPKGRMARKVHSNEADLRIKPGSQVSGSRAGPGPTQYIDRHRHSCYISQTRIVPELECS